MTQLPPLPGKSSAPGALNQWAQVIANHIAAQDQHGDRAAAEEFATVADANVLTAAEAYTDSTVAGLVPDTRTITAGTGLTGGGDLSADRTIALANTAVTPASYGDGTHVAAVTVDQQGRITAASNVAITGAAPSGAAGGDLNLTYPNPGVAKVAGVTPGAAGLSVLDDATIADIKTTLALAAVATSGAASDVSGLATVATSGSASDLGTGTLPLARLVNITDAEIAAANKDGASGTPSLRTLGTGAAQAAAGNAAPNLHATTHSSGGSDPITVSNLAGSVAAAQMPALTGDVTTSAGAVATTLAATAVSAGSYGDASHVSAITVDAKGRLTAAASTPIAIASGAVSGLATIATSGSASDLGTGTVPLARLTGITTSQLSASANLALSQLAQIGNATLIGNNTAGASVPLVLSQSQAVALLALTIGSDVQAYHATLQSLSGLASASDRLPYFSAGSTFSATDLTSVARTLIAQTTQALMRTTGLGLTTVGDAVATAASTTAARSAIGAVIGTDVEAWSAKLDTLGALSSVSNLSALAGLTLASATIPVATGSGAMALDDWDRTPTSFTPVLEGSSTAGVNSYAVQFGSAYRRGKLATLIGRVQLTAKGAGGNAMVGNLQIGGLPYTAVNTTNKLASAAICAVDNCAFVGFIGGGITWNTTKISLYKNTTGTATSAANMVIADCGANTNIFFTITYEIA